MADTLTLNFGKGVGLTIDSDGDSSNLGLSVNVNKVDTIATVYTGTVEPDPGFGKIGDIYLKVEE